VSFSQRNLLNLNEICCILFYHLKLPNFTKITLLFVDEIEGNAALAIIEENPTNFGVWDRVLDPASAKVRVEKAFKQKNSSQIVIIF
jgi:hypothetical protein